MSLHEYYIIIIRAFQIPYVPGRSLHVNLVAVSDSLARSSVLHASLHDPTLSQNNFLENPTLGIPARVWASHIKHNQVAGSNFEWEDFGPTEISAHFKPGSVLCQLEPRRFCPGLFCKALRTGSTYFFIFLFMKSNSEPLSQSRPVTCHMLHMICKRTGF